jgi:transcriptional regulator with XRE-family HTH domain
MKTFQIKMARAAVGWGVRELARNAGVTANTVTRVENGRDARVSTIEAIRAALEAAGVEFLDGEQPGVRLRSYTASDRAQNGKQSANNEE